MMGLGATVEVQAEGWQEKLVLSDWYWLMAAAGWVRTLVRMSRTAQLARMVLLLPV